VTAISDDFNRGDNESLGANWTEEAGDWEIVSNAAKHMLSSNFQPCFARYSGQALSATAQYLKVTITAEVNTYPTMALRMSAGANPFYGVQFLVTEDQVEWAYYPSPSGSSTEINTQALTVTSGDTFGITVEGTGADTVVRVWRNPTGLPSSPSNWNGDTTPDVTFTTDPGANAVDSGAYVGIGGFRGQDTGPFIIIDDFFAGDFASADVDEPLTTVSATGAVAAPGTTRARALSATTATGTISGVTASGGTEEESPAFALQVAQTVWAYSTRTLVSGTPDAPSTPAEIAAAAIWAYGTRTLTGAAMVFPLSRRVVQYRRDVFRRSTN
jgi:hypothetical protein